ncbi:ribosomal protein L24p/L26e, archaeal [Caldisphaera lagunensis DSM 15908]|uniref:Transcription elongation factor Spt5 n=1 Tax=Caldisphaera lagunensis (strain DSM 15908 / JCM 11604 / ANMR 0165 / IC-154) TaxID=1056495 RepID=L0AA30_CALLD|nr:transcription elongation factor Spt5 [Caldisphaera lagunensis]AFZ70279.1 ribosomal protein L24p/L26e, archaeal [Caldisphaera lagunensis DSM 15908]
MSISNQTQKNKIYAISVVGGYEEKIALIFAERAQSLKLDIKSIVYSEDLKGTVIVEIGDPKDLFYLIRGIKNVKRRRPIAISLQDVIKLLKPPTALPTIAKGQLIEVIGGPFKGMKGRIVEVYATRNEADITLLEGDSKIVVTIPTEYIKVTEEK